MASGATKFWNGQRYLQWSVTLVVWICAWAVVAILFASQQVASRPFTDGESVSWGKALQLPVILALFWAIVSPAIFAVVRRFPIDRKTWLQGLIAHFALSIFLSMMFVVICGSIMYWIASNASYTNYDTTWELTWTNIVLAFARLTFHSSMLIYCAVFAVSQTLQSYRMLRERDALTAQLQVDLVSTQLDQLRSQLQPHFLFNTLSAITTLVDTDPAKAKLMIIRLSELLRVVVDQPSVKMRRLQDELDFLHKYIEIQKVRFGNRLVYEEQIDSASKQVPIPFLLVQPIVENAIKHGVCEMPTPCTVKLTIGSSEDRTRIVVMDSGPGQDPDTIVEGVGLRNTKTRLQHLYGDNFEFKIVSDKQGFHVTIDLPNHVER